MENSSSSNSISSVLTIVNSIFDEDISISDIESLEFQNDIENYLLSDNETMDVTQEFEIENDSEVKMDDGETIFPGSHINSKQFGFIFLFLVHKMKLSKNHRGNLYRAFKYILPENNKLPPSYASIVKSHLNDSIKPSILKMCNFCEKKLNQSSCDNENCSKPDNMPAGLRSTYDTIIFNAEMQIIEVLERNWNEIQDYKSNFF